MKSSNRALNISLLIFSLTLMMTKKMETSTAFLMLNHLRRLRVGHYWRGQHREAASEGCHLVEEKQSWPATCWICRKNQMVKRFVKCPKVLLFILCPCYLWSFCFCKNILHISFQQFLYLYNRDFNEFISINMMN